MMNKNLSFSEKVNYVVRNIPFGRIMTYGQVAALAGNPRAARIVGGIAHYGDSDLPWHRVVNKNGGLASGYPGGRIEHKIVLSAEGVHISELGYVAVDEYIWWPDLSL